MKKWLVGLVVGFVVSGAAQAALVDRGGGMLYDTVLNITWLQDANYAKTSGYHPDGLMTWNQANAWANTLVYGGYSDWRLASNSPVGGAGYTYDNFVTTDGLTDASYNITSVNSEMAYMYYVNLGLHGNYTPGGVWDPAFGVNGNGTGAPIGANVGLVNNLQSYYYWSNALAAPNNPSDAWVFYVGGGFQNWQSQYYYSDMASFAWAVRPGDVSAGGPAAAPEPATLALAFAGLGLAGLARRRRAVTVS